jgi:predicted aspartyl protease/tetratricopeptide (TPR) repeat protein
LPGTAYNPFLALPPGCIVWHIRKGWDMAVRVPVLVTALFSSFAFSAAAMAAACKIEGLAQLPVTMEAGKPLVAAKINGSDVKFMIDSGAFFSTLSPASAETMNLPREMAPDDFAIQGPRGTSQAFIARVQEFGLAGASVSNMEFLVAGSSFGQAVGVLGQNVLAFADVEYDLGNGVLRLMRADNCKDAARVYWVGPGEPFSSVSFSPISKFNSHVIGTAYLNGRKIRVLFDTGSPVSILSLRAAERAGVKPGSSGVTRSVTLRGGTGSQVLPTWIAPFDSFRIGSEEIRNTKLRIADIDLVDADMLLGVDFFLSHRVYMAYGRSRVLFTRRGNGAVFDLGNGTRESVNAPGEAIADFGEVGDADGYSRRSAMFAARRDLPRALSDITEAIRLAPGEPEYYYQRAGLHEQGNQDQQALADLDVAIRLRSDHVDARVARARVLLRRLEVTAIVTPQDVIADLDVASSVAARDADIQFDLGRWYAGVDAQESALTAFDLWLPLHRDDSRAADALAFSCRARALLAWELSRALADCNRAVQDRPAISFPLESRGLVHLRLRNFERAISDLDRVVAAQPMNAWALYTRGLAKIGAGRSRDGEADIAAAKAANPRAVSIAISRGLVP